MDTSVLAASIGSAVGTAGTAGTADTVNTAADLLRYLTSPC
ncbi:hypothetical protein [Pandoraea apista]|nr:hypothetical protein [Pandoraea apista]